MNFTTKQIKFVSIAIVVLALCLPFIYSIIKANQFTNGILKNPSIAHGQVNGFSKAYKRTDAINYTFSFEGRTYQSYSSSNGSADDYEKLFPYINGRTFPVLFSKNDPEHYSLMLIVPEDFKEFGISFPDSLNWVKRLLNKF